MISCAADRRANSKKNQTELFQLPMLDVGRGLTEFSNYAKLCTFEYAWSTGEEASWASPLCVASAIWASSTAEEGTSVSAISTDLCTWEYCNTNIIHEHLFRNIAHEHLRP